MSGLVVDASIVGCWALNDEHDSVAAAALETVRQSGAAAPRLLRLEIVNLLITNERRGRMMEAETSAFLTALSRLPISLDERGEEGGILALARRHRLAAYDAAYLELAHRERFALATLDRDLKRAASAAGVEIFGAHA